MHIRCRFDLTKRVMLLFVVMACLSVTSAMWRHLHYPKSQKELVEALKDSGDLRDERVEQVLLSVDRGRYCQDSPYVDGPMPIGFGATISAPHMHVYALQKLIRKLRPGAGTRTLDVGCGSGYLTVCLSELVGPQGLTVGVEHMPPLFNLSLANIKSDRPDLLSSGRLKLIEGDGRKGYPPEAPYDVIHVGAAAEEIPQALIDQLKPGGRMIIPVGDHECVAQTMTIVDKKKDGSVVTRADTSVRFVPLTDKYAQYENF